MDDRVKVTRVVCSWSQWRGGHGGGEAVGARAGPRVCPAQPGSEDSQLIKQQQDETVRNSRASLPACAPLKKQTALSPWLLFQSPVCGPCGFRRFQMGTFIDLKSYLWPNLLMWCWIPNWIIPDSNHKVYTLVHFQFWMHWPTKQAPECSQPRSPVPVC